jgi:hypothetical protein
MAGLSQVKLDNIALDIDPESYQMLDGRRRGSVHRIIDGTTVYQDRGINPSDLTITFSGKLTDVTTLKALYVIYRKLAYSFTFEDFKGMEMTVVFTPGTNSFKADPIYGSNKGYTYTIQLSVVSVDVWFSTSLGFPSDT